MTVTWKLEIVKWTRLNNRIELQRECRPLTKCICHKDFSGYSSVVARSNFNIGGQEIAPQSLTAHGLDRWAQ
jgi:hypothetical protein